jgi:Cysteine rich repeat
MVTEAQKSIHPAAVRRVHNEDERVSQAVAMAATLRCFIFATLHPHRARSGEDATAGSLNRLDWPRHGARLPDQGEAMKACALTVSLFLTTCVLSVAAQPALQPPSPSQLDSRGTPDDQKACERDAQRHCREVLSDGDFAVLGCLRENRAKLTRACQGVLTKYGQ